MQPPLPLQPLPLLLQRLNLLLVVGDLTQQLAVHCLLVEEFVDELDRVGGACRDFYVFEGRLDDFEFLHLAVHFVAEEVCDEFVNGLQVFPVFLVLVFVLHGALGDVGDLGLAAAGDLAELLSGGDALGEGI
jgi:hypothetical protein